LKYNYKKLDYNTEDLESLSNSDLKKVADYWLRQYLLKIESNAGFGERIWCPLKKQSYHYDKIHVCHYYDRGIMSTRYDLVNCHLISSVSNTFDAQVQVEGYKSKHHKEYQEFLIEKYGQEEFDKLTERSKQMKIFYKEDYIEIIKKFRNE
jgi:hypothetical protein